MSGITVEDLYNANVLWMGSAQSWSDFLAGVEKNASFLQYGVTQPMRNAWSGTAAELASDKVSATRGGLITSAGQLSRVSSVIVDFSLKLSQFQANITPLLAQAATNFTISPDGSLTLPFSPAEWSIAAHNPVQDAQLEQERQALQSEIQGILAQANKADDETADELRRLMPTRHESAARPPASPTRAHRPDTSSSSSTSVAQEIAQGFADVG
jgi:hypothetical protein